MNSIPVTNLESGDIATESVFNDLSLILLTSTLGSGLGAMLSVKIK